MFDQQPYILTTKLGSGRFSHVYIGVKNGGAPDLVSLSMENASPDTPTTNHAIKVYKTGHSNYAYFKNEIHICESLKQLPVYPSHIAKYIECGVWLTIDGTYPRIHHFVVYEQYQDNVSTILRRLVKKYSKLRGGDSSVSTDQTVHQTTTTQTTNNTPTNNTPTDNTPLIPQVFVNKVFLDMLSGLSHLHANNIIHTDLKPSNLLSNITADEILNVDWSNTEQTNDILNRLTIYVGDLGSSTDVNKIFTYSVGTMPYCPPEAVFELKFGTPLDIWEAFVCYYRMLTDDYLFDAFLDCMVNYGCEDFETCDCSCCKSDMEIINKEKEECMMVDSAGDADNANCADCDEDCDCCKEDCKEDCEEGCEDADANNNQPADRDTSQDDTDYDSNQGTNYNDSELSEMSDYCSHASDDESSTDDDSVSVYRMLLLYHRILGPIPKDIHKKWPIDNKTKNECFNKKGALKGNPIIKRISISELLCLNYDYDNESAQKVENFLLKGLKYLPQDRITTNDAITEFKKMYNL